MNTRLVFFLSFLVADFQLNAGVDKCFLKKVDFKKDLRNAGVHSLHCQQESF